MRQSRQGCAASRAPQDAVALRTVVVARTYLALDTPDQLRPSTREVPEARVEKRSPCSVAKYRELYGGVGGRWYWHDRDKWSDDKLAEYLAQPTVTVWEAMIGHDSAGFFELLQRDDGSVEVVYFGLVEKFFGRGLGGAMLTRAAREAWALGANRVWLHTCTLDSPMALPNYKSRGFLPFKTEQFEATLDGTRVVQERPL